MSRVPAPGPRTIHSTRLPATAGDADDYIFVHDSTVTGGITLQNGQKLYGEAFGLSINQALNGNPAPVVLVAPGGTPSIAATTGNAVGVLANTANGNRTNLEIRGLTLSTSGASSNAIDITSADAANVAVTISGVIVTGATAEGIDINQGSTGTATVAMSNVTVTSTGTGIDLNETAGTLTVTGFSGITITGATAGAGITVSGATFDARRAAPTSRSRAARPWWARRRIPSAARASSDQRLRRPGVHRSRYLHGQWPGIAGHRNRHGERAARAPGRASPSRPVSATLQSVGGPVLNINNATVTLPLDSATVTSSPSTGITLIN